MLIKFNTGRSGTADNLASHDKHSRSVCHMIEISEADAFLVLRTNSGFFVHEGQVLDNPDPVAKEEKSDEKTTDEASEKTIQKKERRDDRKRNAARAKRGYGKSAS